MKKGIVIITGASVRESKKKFECSHESTVFYESKEYKLNAASATALELQDNYEIIVCTSCEKCEAVMKNQIEGNVLKLDLMNKNQVKEINDIVQTIKKKLDLPVHWVHYGSSTETKAKLPGNNIFLSPWDTPGEEAGVVVEKNVSTFYNVLQVLKDTFLSQKRTKIIIISSLAAIRAGHLFGLDAIQKGAVHMLARTAALDLNKQGIYITEIMPGTTDTGYYDSPEVIAAKVERGKDFGYIYDANDFPIFPAKRIGESVKFTLESEAHIREISLIPFGQHPHLGA